MMDIVDLSNHMKLSDKGKTVITQHIQEFTFDQAGPVIHKGQSVSGAYAVLEGELRVFTYSPEGNEATLYMLRPGEVCVLTLNCLFNDLRYPAWVDASENSRVALIPGGIYRELFSREHGIQNMTVKALSTLVFQLMDALEEVQTCTLSQRLARFILNNSTNDGQLKMTQQNLAGHLGTTREVVAKLVQTFKSDGLIETGRGVVKIKDTVKLASLVTPGDAIWPAA